MTRQQAGSLLGSGKRYFIDETIAIVRFIVPCLATGTEYDADFESIFHAINEDDSTRMSEGALHEKIKMIRTLFSIYLWKKS